VRPPPSHRHSPRAWTHGSRSTPVGAEGLLESRGWERRIMKRILVGIIGLAMGVFAGGCLPTPELQGAEIVTPPASSPVIETVVSTPPIPSPVVEATAAAPVEELPGALLGLVSPAFEAGGAIPARYSCDAENVSPELVWGPPPEGVISYALIMDDPDAPGGTWVHWVVYNIPASRAGLSEGFPAEREMSDGLRQGTNSGRGLGFAGPCPPTGTHRYYLKLFALDQALELSPGGSAADLTAAMEGHILGQAELMGTYSRE